MVQPCHNINLSFKSRPPLILSIPRVRMERETFACRMLPASKKQVSCYFTVVPPLCCGLFPYLGTGTAILKPAHTTVRSVTSDLSHWLADMLADRSRSSYRNGQWETDWPAVGQSVSQQRHNAQNVQLRAFVFLIFCSSLYLLLGVFCAKS